MLEGVMRQGRAAGSDGMQGADASAATLVQGLLRCIRAQALYICPSVKGVAGSDRGLSRRFMLLEELFVPLARGREKNPDLGLGCAVDAGHIDLGIDVRHLTILAYHDLFICAITHKRLSYHQAEDVGVP